MHIFANLIGTQALAIMEKQINYDGPCYVRLVGRKSGVVDWILTIFKVNTTTVLEVYADRIEYSYGSLSGSVLEVIPLSKVSNLLCGYFKPVILLVIAAIFVLLALPTFGTSLIPAVLCLIYYFLKKSVLISVIPNSASGCAVAFKRSIIENQDITEKEGEEIIKVITQLVENANKKNY
ncbi:MAG: hypothetical protein J6S53_05470 [Lentisphaeria bacterium]|nr:hypothetical protein [Lentisphaeria bacterium]